MANYFKYLDHKFVIAPSTEDGVERVVENSCSMKSDLITSTLNVSVLYLTVESDASAYVSLFDTNWVQYLDKNGVVLCYRLGKGDDLTKYEHATPIYWYNDDVLQAKFYVTGVERVAQNLVEFTCVSEVGLLESRHYGGLYTGTSIKDILSDIIGGAFSYAVDDKIASLIVSGYLGINTRRNNLHQVMFALGIVIKHDENGDAVFTAIDTQASTISIDSTYQQGSIKYSTPVSKVIITEHSYIKTDGDAIVTLYEDSSGSDQDEHPPVKFSNPCHSLQVTGTMQIVESGVNYAIVKGAGTLTGKEYTHIQREVSVINEEASADNPLDVPNATLINILNSSAVAERLIKYNSNTSVVTLSFVHDNQRLNDYVDFISPFYEPEEGFIRTMDFKVSKEKTKVTSEVVCGYASAPVGDYYNRVIEITEDQDFIIPNSVTSSKIRIVSIGCGFDGGSGGPGGSAHYDEPGSGGYRGLRGPGGKIYNVEIDTVKGKSYNCRIGKSNGENTLFGDISSELGYSSQYGFICPITGKQYATQGLYDGEEGQDGEQSRFSVSGNVRVTLQTSSFPTNTYVEGVSFSCKSPLSGDDYSGVQCYGTKGSGEIGVNYYLRDCSIGSNGDDGIDGQLYGQGGSGSSGGNGANAGTSRVSISPEGALDLQKTVTINGESYKVSSVSSYGGDSYARGGYAGIPGRGKQGCILVYYRED